MIASVVVHLLQNLLHGAGVVLEVCSCRLIVFLAGSEGVVGGEV